ncbi:hypothetical protein EJ02DRAFT_16184 [Clathrospora elynae]|uniref:RRM domain-containing protein n=1 Tax=Clathrospora elynae TaxID=706981 RepID=A0A6A5SG33_9PLEO|nr:hypothetical protein EJ02DRAFT_16184 [Clathrospora elynae]
MPHLPYPRVANQQHLIFVKNVPGYLVKDAIPKLFSRYNPIDIKNVYPYSKDTTVVVSFRTKHEAARAQQETDQVRLDSVILRVESYNKKRSVRFIRENGHVNRQLGDVDEDEPEDDSEETAHDNIPVYTLPLDLVNVKDLKTTPKGTTWADIAGNRRRQVDSNAPTVVEAEEEPVPATVPTTPTTTPRISVAVPHELSTPGFEHLDHLRPAIPPPIAPSLSAHTAVSPPLYTLPDSPCEADVEENIRKQKEVAEWAQKASVVQETPDTPATYEHIDSTERIRWKHCQNCAFCKMRDRIRP